MTLPAWMRKALFATAAMNLLAAPGFLRGAAAVRELAAAIFVAWLVE
jgi:hypothetical protein